MVLLATSTTFFLSSPLNLWEFRSVKMLWVTVTFFISSSYVKIFFHVLQSPDFFFSMNPFIIQKGADVVGSDTQL